MRDHWAFIHRTGSEPWVLEHIDLVGVREYEALEELTLGQVRQAFVDYLRGDPSWRDRYTWVQPGQGASRRPELTISEADWLSCTQSTQMLGWRRTKASDRNLRLFMTACCRRIWPHLVDERSRKAVELAELDVDGRLEEGERVPRPERLRMLSPKLLKTSIFAATATCTTQRGPRLCAHTRLQVPLHTPIYKPSLSGVFDCAMQAACHSTDAAGISKVHGIDSKIEMHARLATETDAEHAAQCHLIRDIFGYPFEPKKTN